MRVKEILHDRGYTSSLDFCSNIAIMQLFWQHVDMQDLLHKEPIGESSLL